MMPHFWGQAPVNYLTINYYYMLHPAGVFKLFNRLSKISEIDYFFVFIKEIRIVGSNTKFVKVAVTNVREVNQPRDLVPPNSLK